MSLVSSYALRQLRASPGFAATVVLTLGLGIGATSTLFSAVNAVVLRPLPFPGGDLLVRIRQQRMDTPVAFTSPARLADWDRLNRSFVALTGFYTEDVSETSGEFPEKLTRAFVAPRFLEVWGVAPAIGRDFTAEEFRPGGPVAVLVSDAFWRRRLHADPAAVGQRLRFGSTAATIAGVMPAAFRFPIPDVDVWWPVTLNATLANLRDATWYTVVGRLKPHVSIAAAQTDLTAVQSELAQTFPKTDARIGVAVQPLASDLVGRFSASLWLLFAAAAVLLVIAGVNVAALMLVRATDRANEFWIRTSLGAPRRALVVQVLTEAGVLAGAGMLVGLGAAGAATRIIRWYGGQFPRLDEVHVDVRVALFAILVTAGATLACSLAPLVRVLGGERASIGSGRTRTQVSGRTGLQWTFAGTQVALAVVLLSASGLLLRSLEQLARVSAGFDPAPITTFQMSGSYAETADYPRLLQRIDRTLDALRTVPGIESAATAGALPAVPGRFMTELTLAEHRADDTTKLLADNRFVSASYFDTLRIPLLAGERCRATTRATVETAVVNRQFADTYFGAASPIGYHIAASSFATTQPVLISGIVGDVREQGLDRTPGPTVYWCMAAPGPAPFFLVRTSLPPAAMTETLRRKIKEIEPGRAVFGISPLAAHIDGAYDENRVRSAVLASFAAAAVTLAFIGLYGTLSFLVTSRRRELGLRLALGATPGDIVRRFLFQALAVSASASAAGIAASAMFGRALSAMLYGVAPSDPLTISAVVILVLAGATVASLIPSARGARLEPMQVLRAD